MMMDYTYALIGGVMIGLSASFLLLFSGRIAGVSGILYRSLRHEAGDWAWRIAFLFGLLVGGSGLYFLYPEAVKDVAGTEASPILVIAGLLVGFGSVLGNGCTSGHGVCGISRLSPRSIVATIVFMFFGALTVYLLRHFVGA